MPRIRNVGGVRPQTFLVRASRFRRCNQNGTGAKNVLKWNRALLIDFSIQSDACGATTVVKVNLSFT